MKLSYESATTQLGPHIANYLSDYGVTDGKFVRIGSVILTRPFDQNRPQLNWAHADIVRTAMSHPELADKMHRATVRPDYTDEAQLFDPFDDYPTQQPVNDAGMLKIHNAEEIGWAPPGVHGTTVYIEGGSYEYGRALPAARRITIAAFEANLGEGFDIRNDLLFRQTTNFLP